MKICHVTSAHRTDDVRIFQKECSSLAKNENDEIYLVGQGEDRKENKVSIIGLGKLPSNRLARMVVFSRKVINAAIRLDADVYHFHDPELMLYVRKLKRKGKKVIFDSHENYYEQIKEKQYIPAKLRTVIAGLYKKYEDYTCKLLDGAIFPCLLGGKDPFEGRVDNHVLINNVPTIEEIEATSNGRARLGTYVCYAGALTKDRGIEQIIDACYIAKVKLVLAGEFANEEFRDYLKKKEAFSIVDYRGKCNREEVLEIYRNAAMGASTIQWIGQYPYASNLPTKVYEFMMQSLPFVISNFPYCKKVVDEYACGITVDPSNPVDIAAGITQILEDPEQALEMGANGRRAIEQYFNWEIEEQKLFLLYDKIKKSVI